MATKSITKQMDITTKEEAEQFVRALEEAVLLSDVKINTFFGKLKNPYDDPCYSNFVRIEHIPSGIVVTKHSGKSQIEAKNKAMDELIELIRLYNRNDIL